MTALVRSSTAASDPRKFHVTLGRLDVAFTLHRSRPSCAAVVRLGGLAIGSRDSSGSISLATYHPLSSQTWYWGVGLRRRQAEELVPRSRVSRAVHRTGQWHDYYHLPLGWVLGVSYQDYHRRPARSPE